MYSDAVKYRVAMDESGRAGVKELTAPEENKQHWREISNVLAEIAKDYDRKTVARPFSGKCQKRRRTYRGKAAEKC